MRWNNKARIRVSCALIVITFCAGCASSYSDIKINAANHVDLSDPAAAKAKIRTVRWDIGLGGMYCYILAPAKAERMTVNAGTVEVAVECVTRAIGVTEWAKVALISFDALAAHDYVISTRPCTGCDKFKLTDETTGELVAEFPPFGAEREDLSTGDHTATIIGMLGCQLLDRYVNSLVVDAGPTNIAVTCLKKNPTIPSVEIFRSSIIFTAETGHTYYLSTVLHEECIGLYDSTLGNRPISCEPYEIGN